MPAMKVMAPDYYPAFRCTAGACRHTCCEGWEIDIDDEALARYQAMDGEFGERLRNCIALQPEPHFELLPGERCPLLRADGLCDLIAEKGEECLCQICRDHPRFRNYWSDRVETGLGMACEEAARLILSADHPIRLIQIGEDAEEPEEPDEEELALRARRDRLLAEVKETGPAARLKEYLIYRHFADTLYDGRPEERIRFIEKACGEILAGWDGRDVPWLIERVRVFSNEVEYDDEALEKRIAGAQ
ncbi:MAG: flagellin lysine-N-methylase [Clostridia bacterium]|nr:flagellin lysine-N-methylase [Clostridia bacterium]